MNPLKQLISWRIAAFEREHDYDMGYARQILDVSPQALIKFNRIMGFTRYQQDVPLEAWYAAKLAGTLNEDCGPCTLLVAGMAERDGVEPQRIRAILGGDAAAMTPEAALGFRFATRQFLFRLRVRVRVRGRRPIDRFFLNLSNR